MAWEESMKSRFTGMFQIKNSFFLVLGLVQAMIIVLATLMTRLTLHSIDAYLTPAAYDDLEHRLILSAVVISIICIAITGVVFTLLYRGIRRPLLALVAETEKIKNLDLKDKVEIETSLVEFEKLICTISEMKTWLQSFQKYVPENVLRELIETNQEARMGGELKELTVFFSDIVGFTAITEKMQPRELTQQLSEYFKIVTSIVMEHKGTVDKYIGDTVMAFWGAPVDLEEHALLACRAALACRSKLDELCIQWKKQGKHEFHTRIGLSTGEMIVGNFGSDQRLNYSVLGDDVNLASRLEGLNKLYSTSILISEATYRRCMTKVEARFIDLLTIKGKAEPVRIYELIGERHNISPDQKESLRLYWRAIDRYLALDWDKALNFFRELQVREPGDAVTTLYIERCQRFKETPPEPEWGGNHSYTTKMFTRK